MRASRIIAISAFLAALGGIAWWLRPAPGPVRRADGGQPQKSAEAILKERADQAATSLQTPLGQAFSRRAWAEVKGLYQPETQFNDLAEIIRAHFIQNRFASFTSEDMEQVLTLTYSTMERIRAQDWAAAGLLVTQFQRLPLPAKNSALYQRLESWMGMKETGGPLRRLAIIKLATQDLNPPESAVRALIAGYRAPGDGLGIQDWIRVTEEIRSVKVRERCLKELLKAYPQLKGAERAQALIVIGRQPEINGPAVTRITLEHLRSDEPGIFESGLKALGPVVNAGLLGAGQKSDIVKRLTSIPNTLKTPYVSAKIEDLLPSLTGRQ